MHDEYPLDRGVVYHRTYHGHVIATLETAGFLTLYCVRCRAELSRVYIPGPCIEEVRDQERRQQAQAQEARAHGAEERHDKERCQHPDCIRRRDAGEGEPCDGL